MAIFIIVETDALEEVVVSIHTTYYDSYKAAAEALESLPLTNTYQIKTLFKEELGANT